jgi:hypothetical protein
MRGIRSQGRMLEGWGHRAQAQFAMPHSMVKSVQTGTAAIAGSAASGTATITAVVVANSIIYPLGFTYDGTSDVPRDALCHVALTNATTVTGTRGSNASADGCTVGYAVMEFWPGVIRRIQTGTIAITDTNASNTATITAVNTAKSAVIYLGNISDVNVTTDRRSEIPRLALTNSTTVTATRVGTGGAITVGYEVVEYF